MSTPDSDVLLEEAEARTKLTQDENGQWLCPECGEGFKFAIQVGNHRRHKHGVQGAWSRREKKPPRTRARASTSTGERAPRAGSRASETNRLRRELKKSTSALLLLPFMAKGTADRLLNPGVTKTLDEKAEAFADAWVAVAEQNEWVRKNLSTLLAGGVWLNAGAQTLALGYVTAVFSGFTPLHPGALMLLPEMAQFVYQPQPAAETAPANGGQTSGDQVT